MHTCSFVQQLVHRIRRSKEVRCILSRNREGECPCCVGGEYSLGVVDDETPVRCHVPAERRKPLLFRMLDEKCLHDTAREVLLHCCGILCLECRFECGDQERSARDNLIERDLPPRFPIKGIRIDMGDGMRAARIKNGMSCPSTRPHREIGVMSL